MSEAMDYDVQALFLHEPLLAQLFDESRLRQVETDMEKARRRLPGEAASRAAGYTPLVKELFLSGVPEELSLTYVEGTIHEASLVTMTQDFYFRNTSEGRRRMKTTLDVDREVTVIGDFSVERTIGKTGRDKLRGHARVCTLARVIHAGEGGIEIQPLFLGYRFVPMDPVGFIGTPLEKALQTFPTDIDQFSMATLEVSVTKEDLRKLRMIPEPEIKARFAQILEEHYVPKDWGGELSDLVTTQVSMKGRRMTAVFAFKGPSEKGRLTIKKMGKHANQGIRLAKEPADLLVVQHHDEITSDVKALMQAVAREKRVRYMLINGPDTVRILKAANVFD